MKTVYLKKSVPPTYEDVRSLRRVLETTLIGCKVQPELQQKMSLCYSEIATNFIEHGTHIKQVFLSLAFFGKYVKLDLSVINLENDRSALIQWLDKDEALEESDVEFAFLRSGGRGAYLVNHQCDDIQVVASEQWPFENCMYWRNGFSLTWALSNFTLPKRVLVVEDDKSMNALFCEYLASDYCPLSAYSGEEALSILSEHRVDLVLSDMNMPFKSGLELRRSLTLDSAQVVLPFVLTSCESDNVQACSRLGIDDFLKKPVSKSTLLECVGRVLARSDQLQRDMQSQIQGKIHASLQAGMPNSLSGWRFGLKAKSNYQGGGDLLLWEHRGDETLIVLADVMGHDEASKFFSHAYRGYIRGFLSACEALPRPVDFLQKLSDAMHHDHLLNHCLCTMVAILLKPDGRYSIASAGHPPSYVVSGDTQQAIDVGGMLPGLCPNIVYTSVDNVLSASERIVMVTDGIFDERTQFSGGPQEIESTNVLIQLSLGCEEPVQSICGKVFDLAIDQQKHELDDALLLLIERDLVEITESLL